MFTSQYFPVWISLFYSISLSLLSHLRSLYGYRDERGVLLMSLPVPAARKRVLALRLAAGLLCLLAVIWGLAWADTHQNKAAYFLFSLLFLLLSLVLIHTGFSFAPVRLYENCLANPCGLTVWSHLSGVEQRPAGLHIRLNKLDLVRNISWRKELFLFCTPDQQEAVKLVLKERAGILL